MSSQDEYSDSVVSDGTDSWDSDDDGCVVFDPPAKEEAKEPVKAKALPAPAKKVAAKKEIAKPAAKAEAKKEVEPPKKEEPKAEVKAEAEKAK